MPESKKVLLMGTSACGKSSMRSMIFSNYSATDTSRLGATVDVEYSNVRFLNNMALNLWDCGGQDIYMQNFLADDADKVFSNCQVLVFVFAADQYQGIAKSLEIFSTCLDRLREFAPEAKVVILFHKADLIRGSENEFAQYTNRFLVLAEEKDVVPAYFYTSIFDSSIYNAWASVMSSLLPNIHDYERYLEQLMDVIGASEIILFEQKTFLTIVSRSRYPQSSGALERYPKISGMIKGFRQNIMAARRSFGSMKMRGRSCSLYIEALTANICIMIVIDKAHSERDSYGVGLEDENLVLQDIRVARDLFRRVEES